MGDSLSNIDEADAGKQRVLSQKERKFLLTGDPGSYTTAKMERRVASRVELLPERFQQLIDDMSLLHHQGYLDPEETIGVSDGEFSLVNRSQEIRDSPVVRPTGYHSEHTTAFGFEIGSLLRMLNQEPVPDELVWGIIVGLIGESGERWESEAGNLVDLVERIDKKYEERLFTAGSDAQNVGDGLEEERDEIQEILLDHGFAPAPSLIDAVLLEYTDGDSNVELSKEEKSWRADPSETAHPKPPDEMPSQAALRRERFETLIDRFEDQTDLRPLDRLAKDLREDAIRIQRREWRGVDPDQAFRFIGKHGKTQIQKFEQTETKGQNNITTALRRLSYNDSTWVNRPVLIEDRGENIRWELTQYGNLLYSVRVDHNCSTNWMYDFVVNPENFDDETTQTVVEVLAEK